MNQVWEGRHLLRVLTAAFYWFLFIGYLAALYWVSARQTVPTVDIEGLDKVAHAVAYFGLCVVSRLAFGTLSSRRWLATLWAVAVTLLYGAIDEWHQSFVPGRSSDLYDWIADAVGGVAGGTLFLVFWTRRRVRQAIAAKSTPD